MKNNSPLLFWLLKYQERLDLKVNIIEKTQEFLPQFLDVQVSLKIGGIETFGFSTQADMEAAFLKASAEAIERVFAHKMGLNSNSGTAIHTSMLAAKKHALNEVMERDLLMCHLLTNTPFVEYSPQITSAFSKQKILTKLKRVDYQIDLKKMVSPRGYHFVVCVIQPVSPDKKSPVFLSSAGGKIADQKEIENHAIVQCTRKVSYWLLSGKWAIKKDTAKHKDKFLTLWKEKNTSHIKAILRPVIDVQVNPIVLPFQKEIRIPFAVASSKNLQQWAKFPIDSKKINWSRLEDFSLQTGNRFNKARINLSIGNGFL